MYHSFSSAFMTNKALSDVEKHCDSTELESSKTPNIGFRQHVSQQNGKEHGSKVGMIA